MSTDYIINIQGQDNASPQINRIQGGLGGLTAGAGRFKAALGLAAGAFAAIGVGTTIQNTINEFDDLAKSARAAGAASSNEAFQGFQVLKQAMNEAGIDAATFDRAMLQTTTRLQEGVEGNKAFVAITDKLGDSIKTANGELADGPTLLQAMTNALNDGTISTDEFAKVVGGRAGPLIQQQFASLNTSAEDLAATLADVEANSNIVSLEAAENAEVFNDNIGRLKEGMGQLLTDAITPLLPHLVRLSEDIMAKMPAIIEGVQTAFNDLKPVFDLIGTVLTEVVVPIMSKLFEVLGTIAEKAQPLIEAALPKLKEGFEFVADVAQILWDKFKALIDTALPPLQTGFELLRDVLGFVFDKIKLVYDTALPALETGFNGIKSIVETLVEWFNKTKEALQDIYNKAIQLKDATVGAFSDAKTKVTETAGAMRDGVVNAATGMADGVTGAASNMYNGATGWANRMYDEWWGNSIFPDLRDGVISAFTAMADGSISETQRMSVGSTAEAQNFMTQFGGTIEGQLGQLLNNVSSEMGGFQSIFQNVFQNVLGEANGAFSQLTNIFGGIGQGLGGLFGGGGGGFNVGGLLGGLFGGVKKAFGGIFGGIGKLFGGFFANGGYLPSGKFGIAGEAGPEIITGPARVTPMQGGMAMGGGNVTFQINAIDPSTGTQFILDHKDEITGIIQKAYNKRGRTGIY